MKKILLLIVCVLVSCDNSNSDYKNVTSHTEDIKLYELIEVVNYDDVTKINLSIPKFLNNVIPPNEKTIFQYTYFEDKSGYVVSMDKLISRNTQKLSDKEYLDILNKEFLTSLNGDLKEIEKILPPSMKNVNVIQVDRNLIINNNYFGKRISYYEDQGLVGTYLEGVNCTEFHFFTIYNKTKYSLNIIYYGDDKSVSDVIGLFNTIGGSVKFESHSHNRYHVDEITNPTDTLFYLKYDMSLLNGIVYNELGDVGLFKNGQRNGLHREWYENNQLRHEFNFNNGKKDGLGRGWYENGGLNYEGYYNDGILYLLKKWYENGQVEYLRNYNTKTGGRDGFHKKWDEGGTLLWEEYYENGQRKFLNVYENGILVEKKKF